MNKLSNADNSKKIAGWLNVPYFNKNKIELSIMGFINKNKELLNWFTKL
jgi:hypothetical protein